MNCLRFAAISEAGASAATYERCNTTQQLVQQQRQRQWQQQWQQQRHTTQKQSARNATTTDPQPVRIFGYHTHTRAPPPKAYLPATNAEYLLHKPHKTFIHNTLLL